VLAGKSRGSISMSLLHQEQNDSVTGTEITEVILMVAAVIEVEADNTDSWLELQSLMTAASLMPEPWIVDKWKFKFDLWMFK